MKTYSTLAGSGTVLNMSSRWANEALPATLTSGLGLLHVCGRMRVAQPPMGMKIFRVSDNPVLRSQIAADLLRRYYFTNISLSCRGRSQYGRVSDPPRLGSRIMNAPAPGAAGRAPRDGGSPPR
jgi:hypothetical protein